MDLIDELKALSSKISKKRKDIQTEEATKNAFVMPFIKALGYDVFDPSEVTPELTADVGTKKGEKVDYAILKNGKPIILFECKWCGIDLEKEHKSQLYRYFSVTEARFAVLTNGISYYFYTDIDEPNKMDSKHFLELNLLELKESAAEDLKRFSQSFFDLKKNLTAATELKYTTEIKSILATQLANPSEEFAVFFASKVYSGRLVQSVKQQFVELVKKAFQQFLSDRINERLQSALAEPQFQLPSPEIQKVENNQTDLNLSTRNKKGNKPHTLIIMGKSHAVSSWRRVLEITLNTLIETDAKLFETILKKFPKNIAWEKKFRSNGQLSNGAYFETNLNAQRINKLCRELIKLFGLSDEEWQIKLLSKEKDLNPLNL
ncbi:MAG: type I restriction enzyme HsdR N-terminal domain-containing protein [Thiotrichaceae bacterium]|nr:type I restriction enzyme HsdR N-terminal domain-containing protein [Thiotrichaceae bacterium]